MCIGFKCIGLDYLISLSYSNLIGPLSGSAWPKLYMGHLMEPLMCEFIIEVGINLFQWRPNVIWRQGALALESVVFLIEPNFFIMVRIRGGTSLGSGKNLGLL